jgi:hypothetical protein
LIKVLIAFFPANIVDKYARQAESFVHKNAYHFVCCLHTTQWPAVVDQKQKRHDKVVLSKELFSGRVAEVMKGFRIPVYILANKHLSYPYEPVLITCNDAPYQFLSSNEALSGLSSQSIPLLANQVKPQLTSFWNLRGDFELDKRWLNPYNLIITDYKTYSLHNEFFIDELDKSCLVYYK